ncbi:hypothetical protein WJX74_002366 [Apatococcus lobatus]|uniref:Large ribosomal subunit protein uL23c n=1 Tax=Apatococcus lobatus TaxID=904363 RepID=A0AAW1RBE4_9CHLO
MGRSRLPTFLANIRLRLMPYVPFAKNEEGKKILVKDALAKDGFVRNVAFLTQPDVSKPELKGVLTNVYGLNVAKINTLNYEGACSQALLRPETTMDPPSKRQKKGQQGSYKASAAAFTGGKLGFRASVTQPAISTDSHKSAMQGSAGAGPAPSASGVTSSRAAVAPHAGAGPDDDGGSPPPVFFTFGEKKKPAHRPRKHGYTVEFFLVDSKGHNHLAAIGEDQGDAHYIYRAAPDFQEGRKPLAAHNRRELTDWLQSIVQDSQDRGQLHTVEVDDTALSDPNQPLADPSRLPVFITHRQERSTRPDGRRSTKWWLVDNEGHEHLAVTGEERETRDGHYVYSAHEPLATLHPLQSSNMAGVTAWLEKLTAHPDEDGQGEPAAKHTDGAKSKGPRQKVIGSAAALEATVEANLQKRIREDKVLQEKHAQEWVERMVRAGAASRARQQDIAKRAALQWLRTTPTPFVVNLITAQLLYISQSLADLQSLGRPGDLKLAGQQIPAMGVEESLLGGQHYAPTAVNNANEQPLNGVDVALEETRPPAEPAFDEGASTRGGDLTATAGHPAAVGVESSQQTGVVPIGVAASNAAEADSAAKQHAAGNNLEIAAPLPLSKSDACDGCEKPATAPSVLQVGASASVDRDSSQQADPAPHPQDLDPLKGPIPAVQPAAASEASGLQQDETAQPTAQPQQQWGVSQPQQQWGGWLGSQMGTPMPPYLAAQYLQQQAWGNQYSQGLQPGLSGLGASGPFSGWGSSQPVGTHFGQQPTSNPFQGAPAAFPHPMQQDPQGGGDEMTDAPDWQPIPYGSPGHGESEPTAAIGAQVNNPLASAYYGAGAQTGTHPLATPLQSHAHLYGQALQTGIRSMTDPLQAGAHSSSQLYHMQPIQQLQHEAAQAQASDPTPQIPAAAAANDEAGDDSEPLGGLRLVDYTSDDEDRSPSQTEQQSQGLHCSRSLQAGQPMGSMPGGLLGRSQAGLGTLHQSSGTQSPLYPGAARAAAGGDDDSEDMQEPAPPGVGSPAVSGQSRPFLYEPPLYRPTLQFPIPTHAATHSVTAGSLQNCIHPLQRPIAQQSGLVSEDGAQQAVLQGQVKTAAGPHFGQPTAAQAAGAPTSASSSKLQADAGSSLGRSTQPQPALPTHEQPPSLLQPTVGTPLGQQHVQPPHVPAMSLEHGTTADSTTHSAALHGSGRPSPRSHDPTRLPLGPTRDGAPAAVECQVATAIGYHDPDARPAVAMPMPRLTDNAVKIAELQVGVLEALREMGGQHMTLALLTQTGALKAVQGLRSCQHAAIATLADRIFQQWRATMMRHLAVLASPAFLKDPQDDVRQHLHRLTACVASAPKPAPRPFPPPIKTSLPPASRLPAAVTTAPGVYTPAVGMARSGSRVVSESGGPGVQQDTGMVSTPTHLSGGSGGVPAGSWLDLSKATPAPAPGSWSPYGLP